MSLVILRGLRFHWRRFLGVFLAVFLGVAFLAGTLVLGDTMRASFDQVFTEANANTDAVVRSASSVDSGEVGTFAVADRGALPISLLDRVRDVDGVAVAEAQIEGYGQIIGKDGKGIGQNGPPRTAGTWISDPDLSPWRLAAGRAPRAGDEVVIDQRSATAGDLSVGDVTTVQTPQPVRVRVVGIARFGSQESVGLTTYVAFTLDGARQHLTGRPDQITSIVVSADPGVAQQELTRRIQRVLPSGVEALTGATVTRESIDGINDLFLDMMRALLVVFAAIALVVAAFSIHNTFAIVLAQRGRQSALLRLLGASRRQILSGLAAEAAIVGLVASGLGLAGGLGIAALMKTLMRVAGFGMPAEGLSISVTAMAISLLVGLGVTMLAGLAPAIKAARVAPLAALRELAAERAGLPWMRVALGGLLLAGGVAATLTAATGEMGMVAISAGALATLAGALILAPALVRGAAGALGAPLARLRGVSGELARQNAMRNPRRTAATAAALVVGVSVVAMFTVFAASLEASIDDSVRDSLRADMAISAGSFGGGGFSPALARDVARQPEVETATGLGRVNIDLDGDTHSVRVTDPAAVPAVLDLDVQQGDVADLGTGGIAVSKAAADDNGWRIGTPVSARFADGRTVQLRVGAIYRRDAIVGSYIIPRAVWQPSARQAIDDLVLASLEPGVGEAQGRAALERAAAPWGGPDVRNRSELADSMAAGVDMMRGLVYGLLGLAIVIALMGIANTLSLSVHERTREIGLLRAVGQTRGQVRAMVRWESSIVALVGTVAGIALGTFLGWAMVLASSSSGVGTFALPPFQLAVLLVAGAAAGVLAGVRPARRAARLPVLQAVASE